ncbi:MAG: T9SS type A sorting domain-containing protein [Melioribacteraceae bacterium]|nr:T9SS type A sorting domain-containing protein [Melioribacteraceae bacterium]
MHSTLLLLLSSVYPQASDVTVKIFDILGQEVKTLVNRNMTAGFHTVNFDASNLMSGMYIYRIQANGVDGKDFTDVKKMLLVK